MAAAPNFPTYKWWETDDKTKRLYTELLAEKLSSPRKSSGSSLSRKPSNGKEIVARLTSSPKRDTTTGNPTSSEKDVVKKKEEKEEADNKYGKYTFETITIDTLAKYDYIKSPKKRAAAVLPVSFFEQTNMAANQTSSAKDNKEKKESVSLPKGAADMTLSNGHFLVSQKLSSAKNGIQELKSVHVVGEKKVDNKGAVMKKDKPSRAMKLEEIPEYTSSESSESSAEETVLIGKTSTKGEKKSQPLCTDSREANKTQPSGKSDQPLKVDELSNKFQLLSEQVAQLEFKIYEFSDDLKKLKQNMGFKDADDEVKKEDTSAVEKKDEGGVTRQRSFTFADKFNSKALLMKQQASPKKMLAAKPPKFLPAKLTLECTSKEDALAELKKNEALDEIVSKIKEQELSEDDIQEILRCAKDKYIDRPNYLEELGYDQKND